MTRVEMIPITERFRRKLDTSGVDDSDRAVARILSYFYITIVVKNELDQVCR